MRHRVWFCAGFYGVKCREHRFSCKGRALLAPRLAGLLPSEPLAPEISSQVLGCAGVVLKLQSSLLCV